MSSGLLGVDGGLTRDRDAMPPSLPVLRSSNSLKLRRSEFCLKKPGLEESLDGVSGMGEEGEEGTGYLLPRERLSNSMSSYGFSFDGGSRISS